MEMFRACLVFALLCCVSSAYILSDNDDDPVPDIVWPSEYYFKGQTVRMRTGLVQPFRMWYSAEYNRSRLELYDGEINSYYFAGDDEEEGGLYKLLTITTENMTDVQQCWFMGDRGFKDFMPDMDMMENTQSYVINGKVVQEWKREHTLGQNRLEVTVLLYRTEYGVDVPISLEQTRYSLEFGRLVDRSIQEFLDFNLSVNSEDLQIIDQEKCEKFVPPEEFPSRMKFLHPANPFDVDIAFDLYKSHHSKEYRTEEHEMRKAIFHKNWQLVENHNRMNLGYKLALNNFADRTDEELQFLTGTRPSDPGSEGTHKFHSLEEVEKLVDKLPEEFDLRLKGALRPIKQQGQCQSYWAFAAAATVEGALAYKLGGRDVDLSEQSLIDCSWGYNNFGCMGGLLDKTFEYIFDQGIPSDVEYGEYKEEAGKCHVQNLTSTFKIRGFGRVNRNSVNSVKLALLEYGPVAVSVLATHNMYLYSNGIFYDIDCEGGKVNHGLVIVGYGVRNGDLYWIVRNSWGEYWGEDGYILMAAGDNNCFLLGEPYYVVV